MTEGLEEKGRLHRGNQAEDSDLAGLVMWYEDKFRSTEKDCYSQYIDITHS